MTAHGNLAIALGSIGRFEEGRHHAPQAISIAQELAAGWRHADAHDVLAIVEIAADRPLAALQAIDEALVVLGEIDHTMLRYQLAVHRTWALAMLGRAQSAKQWLARGREAPRRPRRGRRDRRAGPRRPRAHARSRPAASRARRSTRPWPHVAAPARGVRHGLAQPGRRALRARHRRRAPPRASRWSAPRCPATATGGCSRIARSRSPSGSSRSKSGDSRVVRYAERTLALVNAMSAETLPGAAAVAHVRRSPDARPRPRIIDVARRAHRGRDAHLRDDAAAGDARSARGDGQGHRRRDAGGRHAGARPARARPRGLARAPARPRAAGRAAPAARPRRA